MNIQREKVCLSAGLWSWRSWGSWRPGSLVSWWWPICNKTEKTNTWKKLEVIARVRRGKMLIISFECWDPAVSEFIYQLGEPINSYLWIDYFGLGFCHFLSRFLITMTWLSDLLQFDQILLPIPTFFFCFLLFSAPLPSCGCAFLPLNDFQSLLCVGWLLLLFLLVSVLSVL